jgi:hydroxyethylthiazole kinase-like uncharacterized protein yjeF
MRQAHTVDQVRDAEGPLFAALPPGTLMQRAAAGLAAYAVQRLGALHGSVYGRRVVLLVGSGDNGGDALWAGARLAARGARVEALATGRMHAEGSAALLAAGGRVYPAHAAATAGPATDVGGADLVLDGLLGTGGRPGLRGAHAHLAGLAPPQRTVAVDVPSGVDADTGEVGDGAVVAAATVTFGTYKRGLLLSPAASHVGRLHLVPIGLRLPPGDLCALDAEDVAALLPRPGPSASKYTRGVVGIVAGSDAYPGAAVLCAGAALRGGAGFVRYVGTAKAAAAVRAAHPEVVATEVAPGDADAVLGAGRVQAWIAGPGMGTGPEAERVLAALLATDLPVLVDADAITVAARRPDLLRRAAPTLLTPHVGEFARLTGREPRQAREALAADRLGTVRSAAAELGVSVLLKGNRTLVVEPGGDARVNTSGTPWLSTAGSGDVLSGLAGALLATGLGPLDAGSAGAWLHGLAAEVAKPPLVAGDLLASLPSALSTLAGPATAL